MRFFILAGPFWNVPVEISDYLCVFNMVDRLEPATVSKAHVIGWLGRPTAHAVRVKIESTFFYHIDEG